MQNTLKGLPTPAFRSRLVTLTEPEAIEAVLDEIMNMFAGFEIAHTPIELINYHEKCPL